jgi:hypothetical protein
MDDFGVPEQAVSPKICTAGNPEQDLVSMMNSGMSTVNLGENRN